MNAVMHASRSFAAASAALFAVGSASLQAARLAHDGRAIELTPEQDAPAYQLRIAGPDGLIIDRTVLDVEPMRLRPGADGWVDGSYRYEIVPITGDARRAEPDGSPPPSAASARTETGAFRIDGGQVLPAGDAAERAKADAARTAAPSSAKDQVVADDLIVQAHACVGVSCANNENFGLDTVRLKEDIVRLRFEDTSSVPGFPSTDWQLVANDWYGGGLNRFSIEDLSAGGLPFSVLGGAPNDSLFVGAEGRIGFRTSTPARDLHVNTGNSPTLRLEQNGSVGFTAQAWDIGGNEAGLFVRDVTYGNRLPLRIRPGAPTGALDIGGTGNVGIGTTSPAARLHVAGADGKAALLIRDTHPLASGYDMIHLDNSGPVRMRFSNRFSGLEWLFLVHNNDLRFITPGSAVPQFTLYPNGNVAITGTLSQMSDRAQKNNFRTLDHDQLLDKIAALPIREWSFKAEGGHVRHVGPTAQDFRAAFGLGDRDDRIAPLDTSGIALAAVQALQKELAERDRRIAELEARLQRLDALSQQLAQTQRQLEQRLPAALAAQRDGQRVDTAAGL